MPEVEHSLEVGADVDTVWRYVEVLENWAPFVIGFQKLQIVDDRTSVWTLRGDVGILSREVDIQADITVWEPGERVEFTVTGISERLDGDGYFVLRTIANGAEPTEVSAARPEQQPGTGTTEATHGWFRRLRARFVRFALRRLTRKSVGVAHPPARPAQAAHPADPADPGGPRSVLSFRLRVTPLGPMAPMLELLMAPMLEPAAEDLANEIRAAVEAS